MATARKGVGNLGPNYEALIEQLELYIPKKALKDAYGIGDLWNKCSDAEKELRMLKKFMVDQKKNPSLSRSAVEILKHDCIAIDCINQLAHLYDRKAIEQLRISDRQVIQNFETKNQDLRLMKDQAMRRLATKCMHMNMKRPGLIELGYISELDKTGRKVHSLCYDIPHIGQLAWHVGHDSLFDKFKQTLNSQLDTINLPRVLYYQGTYEPKGYSNATLLLGFAENDLNATDQRLRSVKNKTKSEGEPGGEPG